PKEGPAFFADDGRRISDGAVLALSRYNRSHRYNILSREYDNVVRDDESGCNGTTKPDAF
ncbi:MAG: hypothetical protein Q8S58_18840, partial [Bosea sp. (in: a-proteobacteria)]|nr:hypothetical protein [Bosea sp. (in: a-proteobacteria)]